MNTYDRNYIPKHNPFWKEKKTINSRGNPMNGTEYVGYGSIEFDNKDAWLQNRKLPRASKKRTSLKEG